MSQKIACFSILLLLAASCDDSGGDDPKKESVGVRILDWKETQALVASHAGKVVVLDVWSTSCPPCIRELPGLVELHRKHGAKRVVCLTVSCDYMGLKDEPPEAFREDVLGVLRRVGATFDNILLSVSSDEFFKEIALASIPAVYVYGPDGKFATRFDNDSGRYGDGGFNYTEHISPLVEKLLAGK